jgi:proton glutamate symport protein
MPKLALHWQILIAIVLAVIVGNLTGDSAGLFGVTFYSVFDFVGRIFINALKMLIVPLVVASMIVGISNIGQSGAALGRIGGRTVAFYALTTTLAVLVGLALVDLVKPGVDSNGQPVGAQLALEADTSKVAERVAGRGAGDVVEIFVRMVPENIVKAAAEAEMLGLIFFALLFGFFITRLPDDLRDTQLRFWQGVFEVMMRMTGLVMAFAPLGVFGLVAKVAAKTGFDAAQPLVLGALTVVGALAIHALITVPLLLRFVARVNPWRMYQAMSPALLTAFSTASSNASLPVNMECLEKRVGVSPRISSFVLPLGATINMNGTALYECVSALFIAQAYGLDLSFGQQAAVVFMAVVTSIGVAGIPAASLVAIAIILAAMGLPVEAIGVLFVFDRILDMARTSLNVFGDAVCAVIIARMEGERTQIDV